MIKNDGVTLPDYIGLWIEGPFNEHSFRGKFKVYIDERKEIDKDYEFIKGFLEDEFGKALFEGTVGRKYITFHTRYIESHLHDYQNFAKKYYTGNQVKNLGLTDYGFYQGNYGFDERGKDGVQYYPKLRFIMKKINSRSVEPVISSNDINNNYRFN